MTISTDCWCVIALVAGSKALARRRLAYEQSVDARNRSGEQENDELSITHQFYLLSFYRLQ